MTLNEAKTIINTLRPSAQTEAQVAQWVTELDGRIFSELMANRSPNTGETFPTSAPVYTADTAGSTVLLCSSPELCEYRLCLRSDLSAGDLTSYSAYAALYNTAWEAYAAEFYRTHG